MNNFITELLFVILALIFVSLLVWLTIRAMKTLHPGKYNSNKIEILASMAIGTRERVIIIKHNEHEYLLGVSAGGITLLEKTPVKNNTPVHVQ